MDSTDHYSVKLIFQAHLRMYSLTHTDSFVQPIADTNRQSFKTAQAALFLGICNVQSCQGIFTSELFSRNIPGQSTVNQQNNTRTENNGESSIA
jgi:hypothetical protein